MKPTTLTVTAVAAAALSALQPFSPSALCSDAPSARPNTARPNVIFFLIDDVGREWFSSYGSTTGKTPAIDRLAASGVRFTCGHAMPVCTPTRVEVMTGKYNIRNYVNFGMMRPEEKTFGNFFHDAGYATAFVGKWQLGGDTSRPAHWGFDNYCLHVHPVTLPGEKRSDTTAREDRYKNPVIIQDGKRYDYTNSEYGPDVELNYALKFITDNKDHPFFLYFPTVLVHNPFFPTPDQGQKYVTQGFTNDNDNFPPMISYTDKIVAALLARLDELHLRDNTLIVLMGDNGTNTAIVGAINGHEIRGGKALPIDAGSHVPFIASWPAAIKPNQVFDNIVDGSDILPTLCDAANIPLGDYVTDGHSFLPQMRGDTAKPAREWSYFWYMPKGSTKVQYIYARDEHYKLTSDGKLYDILKDPLEKSPLNPNALTSEAAAAKLKLQKPIDQYAAPGIRPAGIDLVRNRPDKQLDTEKKSRGKAGKSSDQSTNSSKGKRATKRAAAAATPSTPVTTGTQSLQETDNDDE